MHFLVLKVLLSELLGRDRCIFKTFSWILKLLFSEQEAKQAGAAERRRLSLSPRKPTRTPSASPAKSTPATPAAPDSRQGVSRNLAEDLGAQVVSLEAASVLDSECPAAAPAKAVPEETEAGPSDGAESVHLTEGVGEFVFIE